MGRNVLAGVVGPVAWGVFGVGFDALRPLGVFDGVCVADRPAEPFRQLCGEMAGVEVSSGHALAEHDRCGTVLSRRITTMI